MEDKAILEMPVEELLKAAGGENDRSVDLMIRLFKLQGRKMEEVYQFKGLSDEQREYIRSRWYQI